MGKNRIQDTLSSKRQAIVDTGASSIFMLETDYANFVTTIEAALPDFICNSQDYNYCYSETNTCDVYWEEMEPLTFYFVKNKYTIPPQGYTLSNSFGWPCVVAVTSVSDTTGLMVLGDSFLRNFVTSFDYQLNYVSFAVSANAPPGTLAQNKIGLLDIVFIVFGSLVFVALIACFIHKRYCANRRRQKKAPRTVLNTVDTANTTDETQQLKTTSSAD